MKIKGLKISCEEFVNPKLFSINNTRIDDFAKNLAALTDDYTKSVE